jgi:hypothetical protein
MLAAEQGSGINNTANRPHPGANVPLSLRTIDDLFLMVESPPNQFLYL